jgi:hypothetical protein
MHHFGVPPEVIALGVICIPYDNKKISIFNLFFPCTNNDLLTPEIYRQFFDYSRRGCGPE